MKRKREEVKDICTCDFWIWPHERTAHCRQSREDIAQQVEDEWEKRLDDYERARDMAQAGGVPLK